MKQNPEYLVERLIIIHLGFVPDSSSGGFDENASNDELCEQILYYNQHDRSLPSDIRCRYNVEEAIKFAGLCTAFYSIQSTIDNQMSADNDEAGLLTKANKCPTREVHLSSCTLVFIPLESSEVEGILAVAQLPRRPPPKKSKSLDKTKKTHLSDDHIPPEEMRHKLQKAHDLFKLTNGSIHQRLLHLNNEEMKNGVVYIESNTHKRLKYVGMDELYDLLKKVRKTQWQMQYQPTEGEQILLAEITELERQLEQLTKSIPIDAVRLDLRQFYDSFLRHIGESEC